MAYTAVRITGTRLRYEDDNGNPAVGFVVWTCLPGLLTLANTWQDINLTALNSNPVILDSRGECNVFTNAARRVIFCLPTSTGPGDGIILDDDNLAVQPSTDLKGDATPVTLNNNYIVTVSPAPVALTDRMTLIMTPDLDNADTIVSQTFTGTGINDAVFTGPYVGSVAGAVYQVVIDSVAASIDSAMKLLLHCDGSGASFVDSETTPKTVTAHGSATQSAVQSKFGGKSALFASAGDYLSLADSDDWYLAAADFTIEGWWYFNTVADATFVAQYQDANNLFRIDYVNSSNKFRFYAKDTSTVRADYDYVWTPTLSTWYHIEIVRSGSSLLLFINGTLTAWTHTTTAISTTALANLTGLLTIGYNADPAIATNFIGYMDEFCWSTVARHTATFVAATQAYSTAGVDTFKWRVDGGAYTALVPIDATRQILSYNIGITFSEVSGHTLGDIRTVTVTTPARVNLNSLGNKLVYKNVGGVLQALAGGDLKSTIPATLVYSLASTCWILNNPSTAAGTSVTIPQRVRKELIADYAMLVSDEGNELSCKGTFTITLLTAPNFANKFFYIRNNGTGFITVNGGLYPIYGNGTTSFIIGPGSCFQFESNGVDWNIITSAGGTILIGQSDPSGITTGISFTGLIPGVKYRLEYELYETVSAVDVLVLFNGDTGANYVSWFLSYNAGQSGAVNTGGILIAPSPGLGSSNIFWGKIEFETYVIGSTPTHNVKVMGEGYLGLSSYLTSGVYNGAADMASVKILAGGNPLTGRVKLYQVD